VGAGMIEERARDRQAARDAKAAFDELEFRASRVTPAERYSRAGHHAAVVWLAARREVAYLVEAKLFSRGCQVHVVAEETESPILPELAQLLTAAGLINIFSVSRFDDGERERARRLVGEESFVDIAPGSLPSSDEQAAREVCDELERRGVIRPGWRFSEGEGI
jgi:hypothetical protein